MSDDFDRLRRTMSELSEHAGRTDLYDRTLRTSRRMTGRRNAWAGGAVAAAVLALGVPVALAGWNRSAPPAPVAASPSPSPASPSPSPSPSPSASPSRAPSSSSPATGESTRGSSKPPASGCPVSSATLTRAAEMTGGWRIDPATIKCAEGWAAGESKPPPGVEAGDGVTLFRYTGGGWQRVDEGSALECAQYGVPEEIGRRIGACG